MPLYLASIYEDLSTDDPLLFSSPDQAELARKVKDHVEGMWADMMPDDEPMPDDLNEAMKRMEGRIVYEWLEIIGYGFLSHETLNKLRLLLLEYEEDREMDLKNVMDDDDQRRWESDIQFSKTLRTEIEGAIK